MTMKLEEIKLYLKKNHNIGCIEISFLSKTAPVYREEP